MSPPHRSPLAVAGVLGAWGALKLLSVFAWVIQVNQYSDTYYYFLSVRGAVAEGSVARWLTEYPTPAAWVLHLPYLAGGTTEAGYRAGFLVLVSLVDLGFVVLLLRRVGVRAAAAWVLLTTLAGQLPLLRFDVVPAVLAAAGLLLILQGRTVAATPWLALGAAAKMWPVLFFPLALGRSTQRVRALTTFAASGLVLVVVSVAGAGWARLLSPLTYQAERGLQVESVAATLPMLASLTRPGYAVRFSEFKAYEVTGPGVDLALQAAQASSMAALVLVVALLAWWFARGCPAGATGYLALLMVALFVATSKAYSPQYTLWLAAVAVVVVGVSDEAAVDRHWGRVLLAVIAALTLLTTAVYPTYYAGIVAPNELSRIAVTALALRNGLLVALVALLVALVVARLRSGSPSGTTVR